MMTPREYLYSLGLTKAPTGRGRFSREANAALDKARAEGMTFKEITPSAPKRTVTVSDKPKSSTPVVEGLGEAYLRYGRMDMSFEGLDANGKRHVVSGRCACSCGYSLVGHTCDNPTALIGGGERIEVTPIV